MMAFHARAKRNGELMVPWRKPLAALVVRSGCKEAVSPVLNGGIFGLLVPGDAMEPSPLLRANRRVTSAQRIYSAALDRLRLGDMMSMTRLSKASYILGLARERYVQLAKQGSRAHG